MQSIQRITITFLLVGLFISCSSDDQSSSLSGFDAVGASQGFSASGSVESDAILTPGDVILGSIAQLVKPLVGATLTVGETSFRIPPGAISVPAIIHYSLLEATPPPGLLDMPKRVFHFSPGGLVFLRDCELIVPFSALGLEGIDPRQLSCFYYNPVTHQYEPQPTRVDIREQYYLVTIRHFSIYGFGRAQ